MNLSYKNVKVSKTSLFFSFISVVAVLRLTYAGWVDSMDFTVYWKAAWMLLREGVSPFAFTAADRGFVFKYPPWALPLFFPFGFMSLSVSKLIWAGVEIGSLSYCIRWVIRQKVSSVSVVLTVALFWWIWLAHFYAGQFTLVLLAVSLWWEQNRHSPARSAFLVFIFSIKILSLTTLLGAWKEIMRLRVIFQLMLWLVCGSSLVLLILRAQGTSISLLALLKSWVEAASSGGQELGAIVVRGQMNHGFTAGILRNLGVDAKLTQADILVCFCLTAFLGVVWKLSSKRLIFSEQWAGWIALGLIVHPLAWHHSFVLAFPLCALSLDRSIFSKNRILVGCSLLGICCIGIFIPNVIGSDLVRPLELVSVKSWGVCLSAFALVKSGTRLAS